MDNHHPANISKGYIHVYTGDGKGKTTAALGLALRAAGHGRKTFMAQFMKKMFYGELESINKFLADYIHIRQFGLQGFHHAGDSATPEEQKAALAGLNAVRDAMKYGEYDVYILDEVNLLVHFNIVDVNTILELIALRPPRAELILTGRRAPDELINIADLVTEMKEIKHYYNQGVQARDGIEK